MFRGQFHVRSNVGFVDMTGWAEGEDLRDFLEVGRTGCMSDSPRPVKHGEELKLRGGSSPGGCIRRRLEQRAEE